MTAFRPAGARCLRCNRPARLHRQNPALATSWCSDGCRIVWFGDRDRRRMRELADEVRRRAGLADGRGPHLTVLELEKVLRVLRLLPYDGMFHLPLSKKADGRYRRRAKGRARPGDRTAACPTDSPVMTAPIRPGSSSPAIGADR